MSGFPRWNPLSIFGQGPRKDNLLTGSYQSLCLLFCAIWFDGKGPNHPPILDAALHNIIYADERNANIMMDYFQGSHGDETPPVGAAVIKKCFVPFRLADASLSGPP